MMKGKSKRWSNYEPDPHASSVVPLEPADVSLKVTIKLPGERPQNLDFSFMKDRPEIASLIAKVMRSEGPRYAHESRKSFVYSVRALNEFIKSERPDTSRTSEITYDLLQEFAAWLINIRKMKAITASNIFLYIRALLRAAKSLYPGALPPDFEVPANSFGPNVKRQGGRREVLSDADLQKILRAAEKEADMLMKKYRDGDVPEGFVPFIPFMLLIAARTAINPESLYNLKRDCLKPHPIDTKAFYVVWIKRRSKAGVQRQLHSVDPRGKGVVELLQFLRAYTQPLVAWASEYDQESLFLYRYGNPQRQWTAVARKPDVINREVGAFCQRHNLREFKLCQLRPSVATQHYKKTGGNLRKVQMFLGHVEIGTTERYIGEEIVRGIHRKSIRAAQDALVKRVTVVIPQRAVEALDGLASEITPEQREKIADGSYDTGLCKCRNPFDSPQPGQQKGRCCTLFMACVTCPNALFFLEDLPRVIALRNHLIAEKKSMRREVWEVLYQDRVRIIEDDIIGAFSKAQVAEAERQAIKVTEMPILMANGALK